ncbi:MAG TPA: glutathione binding-like protein [Reyranella sp.]|jgi:glutathione S-transferase|nr:glutathione binding-like protein [Reyranella sp.]
MREETTGKFAHDHDQRFEALRWMLFENHKFTGRPTIVDFSLAGYVFYPAAETGFDIEAQFPAINAWRQRLAALPGFVPPYELMNVGNSVMPVR